MFERWDRLAWLAPLLVALFHGGLYATYLPPWGMIDEPQHFHYVQHLAEQAEIPTTGKTFISTEIIRNMHEVNHWEIFHSNTPESDDPGDLGLLGHSYEGYQPPLYYALLVPLYRILPDDLLAKLYGLRWMAVGLSVLTVWIAYRICLELFPENTVFAYSVSLFLALLPERAASIGRINNDVLVEVLAAAFIWVLTRAVLQGLTFRRSLLLGVLLGLGVLAKTSMAVLAILLPLVLWTNCRSSKRLQQALTIAVGALVLIVPLLIRNLSMYGDLTGYSAFAALYIIPAPPLTLPSLVAAIWDLFRHNWVVWWKSTVARPGPLVTAFYALLAILSGYSLVGLLSFARRQHKSHKGDRSLLWIAAIYAMAIGSYGLAVLISYLAGQIPVIQGRFLLPVIVPIAILLIWGLWHAPHQKILPPVTLLVLAAFSFLSLFGNLLLYYYYWSAVVAGEIAPWHLSGWPEAWDTFYARFLSDKPVAASVLLLILILYAASLILATVVYHKLSTTPHSISATANRLTEA